jgi:hypothetical protein
LRPRCSRSRAARWRRRRSRSSLLRLFAREDAIEEEWRIVAPILAGTTPPHEYQAGTWGPAEADRLIDRPGGWHDPLPESPAWT